MYLTLKYFAQVSPIFSFQGRILPQTRVSRGLDLARARFFLLHDLSRRVAAHYCAQDFLANFAHGALFPDGDYSTRLGPHRVLRHWPEADHAAPVSGH